MMNTIQTEIPISGIAHLQAQAFSAAILDVDLAERVYLNTLAVYAVEQWLNELGIATHWAASDSWEPNILTPPDAADLIVEGVGKLECRPLRPQEDSFILPPAAWGDRVAYVAVGLTEQLDRVQLLGYSPVVAPDVELESIDLMELRCIGDLTNHLGLVRDGYNKLIEADDLMAELKMVLAQRSIKSFVAQLVRVKQDTALTKVRQELQAIRLLKEAENVGSLNLKKDLLQNIDLDRQQYLHGLAQRCLAQLA